MAIYIIQKSLLTLINILVILIFCRIVLSWVRPGNLESLTQTLYILTEPILGPVREKVPTYNGIDFSPIVAIFLLDICSSIILSF